MQLTLAEDGSCDRVPVSQATEYFIPDRAQPPFPLPAGQELWVEVTVTPKGPPRAIQIALTTKSGFPSLLKRYPTPLTSMKTWKSRSH
jgi:hypothetical protein